MLASIGFGIGLCIALSAGLLVLHLRQRAIEDGNARLASYAMMLSAHVESSFTVLEAVQDGVLDQLHSEDIKTEDRFISLIATPEMQQLLKARVSAIPYLGAITLLDNRGILVNSSYYWPVPYRYLADRDYFRILSAKDAPDRYVSEPLRNRATGFWTIYIARRISSPNGDFLGILLGEINFSYFQNYFAEVAPEPDTVVSMLHLNGVILVRQPPVEAMIGTAPKTAAFRLLAGGRDHGTIRNVSPVDGIDRLAAIHRLPHYPLVVSLSRAVAAILQPWWEQTRYLVILTALLEAGLAGIVLLGVRHFKGRDRLAGLEASLVKSEIDRAVAEESDRNERAIAAYHARFTTAVNAMTQGLCMFDTDNRLIVSNPRLGEIFALPVGALTGGASFGTVVRSAVASRAISVADVRWLAQAVTAQLDALNSASTIWDIADGHALSVNVERMDDQGWLMTFTDITDRRRTEAQIAHMARHDGLTGLANRLLFHERLVAAVALAARGSQHGVLYLDLDHFKDVNDTLGHPIGDALLQAVTARLRRCSRETDTIARLGGDEFAIILPLMQHPMEAGAFADRIIEELSLPFDLLGHQVVIGVSIGIALTPDDGLDADVLLKCADLALYRAKTDGRNCCRYFKPEMDAVLQARRALESDLRRAFALDEFEVFYQPLINTASGKVSAFEALLRWRCADRPAIGPNEFIPVAEEMGLIVPLGKWVLETACNEAMTWPDEVAVAVNLSPVQFRSRNLVEMVRGVLDSSGLTPSRLELEITEGLLLHDTAETLSTLHRLRDLGVRISMDDFGTGYSSLSYLLKFPFDKVKIDRSFMMDLGNGGDRDVIVRAITAMCHALGMQTTGEGVETERQLAFLRQQNCTETQGFLFSRAVPATRVAALLDAFETNPAVTESLTNV
jgi:diguanylate cyclase (GGDEF)-like protein